MNDMLIVQKEGMKFFYRAVAVIIDPVRDRILLHRVGNNPYWSLPGGRVEMMESAQEAVIREVQEELGVTTSVQRLLWVIENFFVYNSVKQHELGMYFLLQANDELTDRGNSFTSHEEKTTLSFQWFDRSKVSEIDLYPRFLRQALLDLPQTPQYIIHRD